MSSQYSRDPAEAAKKIAADHGIKEVRSLYWLLRNTGPHPSRVRLLESGKLHAPRDMTSVKEARELLKRTANAIDPVPDALSALLTDHTALSMINVAAKARSCPHPEQCEGWYEACDETSCEDQRERIDQVWGQLRLLAAEMSDLLRAAAAHRAKRGDGAEDWKFEAIEALRAFWDEYKPSRRCLHDAGSSDPRLGFVLAVMRWHAPDFSESWCNEALRGKIRSPK